MVADTRLSEVDGERGRLIIAGHDVEELAGVSSFEQVVALLWNESAVDLGAGRVAAFASLPALDFDDGMDALRAGVAQLRTADRCVIAAAPAVYAAAWIRRRAGQAPVPPEPTLGHAADYLRMATGAPAAAGLAGALDAYLTTVVDHGLNASTFAARVVASTGSDDVSAVVAAIGALKGPLHGGAPGPVLDMLDAVGTATHAPAWIAAELAAGRRIMGMGHRIYRVRDPRAALLERVFDRLGAEPGASPPAGTAGQGPPDRLAPSGGERLGLARAVEQAASRLLRERRPERPALHANVEFYTAVVLEAVGLPRAAFSATFAVSRVAGWLAHTAEQRATGRLIRPASRYVGERPRSAAAAATKI